MEFQEALQALPTLGVGLSLSFGMEPDPVAMAKTRGGPSFIEYAGAVQHEHMAAPVEALRRMGVPVLYHPSCLNLCGPWPNPKRWLDAVAEHCEAVDSPWLAQDVSVCFVGDEPGYSIQLGYFIPPILTQASLKEAIQRVGEVRSAVPRPLLLEPAPVTFQLGDMTIFEWLGALARETDCGLLLDAGHVVSHQLIRGVGLTEGLEPLDFERVVELHIAGGVIQGEGAKRYYLDAHDLPILPETWEVFLHLLARCPNLRAVCVECEGAVAQAVLPVLRRAREAVALRALNPALRDVARAALQGERA